MPLNQDSTHLKQYQQRIATINANINLSSKDREAQLIQAGKLFQEENAKREAGNPTLAPSYVPPKPKISSTQPTGPTEPTTGPVPALSINNLRANKSVPVLNTIGGDTTLANAEENINKNAGIQSELIKPTLLNTQSGDDILAGISPIAAAPPVVEPPNVTEANSVETANSIDGILSSYLDESELKTITAKNSLKQSITDATNTTEILNTPPAPSVDQSDNQLAIDITSNQVPASSAIAQPNIQAAPTEQAVDNRSRYRKADDFIKSPKGGMVLAQIAMATNPHGSQGHQLAATMYEQFKNQATVDDESLLTPEQRDAQQRTKLDERRVVTGERTADANIQYLDAQGSRLGKLNELTDLQIVLGGTEREWVESQADDKFSKQMILEDKRTANDITKAVTLGNITYEQGQVIRQKEFENKIKLAHFNYELALRIENAKNDAEKSAAISEGWINQQKLYNQTSGDVWKQTKDLHATAITADSYILEDRALIVKEYADRMDTYLDSALRSGGMSVQHAQSLQTQQIYQVLTEAYPGAQVSQPKYTAEGPIFKVIHTPTRGPDKGKETSIILDARGNIVK